MCSLHGYLHVTDTPTTFDDETDARMDAETEQQRPTFRITELCFHVTQFGAKSWKFRFANIRVDAANATGHFPAQIFMISSFTASSSTSVTRKKLGLQIRSLHRKKSELRNLKI